MNDNCKKQTVSPVAKGVTALILSMIAGQAAALGLGGIHVRSSLGEPLRAEVDVTSLAAGEEDGLQVRLADATAYQRAGLEVSPALMGADVSLKRRSNGQAYLSIQGRQPVQDPFVDIVLQTHSSLGGAGSRGYTVLIDPPGMFNKAAVAAPAPAPEIQAPAYQAAALPQVTPMPTAAPVVQAESQAVARAEAKVLESTKAPQAPEAAPTRVATAVPKAPVQARPVAKPKEPAVAQADGAVRVQKGDTAGAIARRLAAQQGVSFDQMLAALLRNNQGAFIHGDVNLVKAGAVLQVPSKDEAESVSRSAAREQWVSSGRNFHEYRRKLAQVKRAPVQDSVSRKAGGKVELEAKDQAVVSQAQDKLTIGKANKKRLAADEAALRQRQDLEATQRTGELSKNIDELKKLAAQTTPTKAAAAGTKAADGKKVEAGLQLPALAASAEGAQESLKATAVPQAEATVLAASPTAAPTAADTPEPTALAELEPTVAPDAPVDDAQAEQDAMAENAEASADGAQTATENEAAPAAPAKAAPVQENTEDQSSLADKAMALMMPWGVAGLGVVALAGLGLIWRRRKQEKLYNGPIDFLESELDAESYFEPGLGEQVNTDEHDGVEGAPSSMLYSPSQLDAAGDVDPVAEAGVYMAYNRDDQAEEILKEAMRKTPTRAAIYTSLMEIYARRGDVKAFNVVGREAYHLTGAQGADWDKAAALGRELDPSNPMYVSGAAEGQGHVDTNQVAQEELAEPLSRAATAPMPLEEARANAQLEPEDLDLPFALSGQSLEAPEDDPSSEQNEGRPNFAATAPMSASWEEKPAEEPEPQLAASGFDLNFEPDAELAQPVPAPAPSPESADATLSQDDGLAFEDYTEGGLKFDLNEVSLDLPKAEPEPPVVPEAGGQASVLPDFDLSEPASLEALGPWETKLELAKESFDLGEFDAARMYAEEVAGAAPVALAQQAQALLDRMGNA